METMPLRARQGAGVLRDDPALVTARAPAGRRSIARAAGPLTARVLALLPCGALSRPATLQTMARQATVTQG
eukprot:3747234-Alexandrium_andersonii.AAC.1